MTRTYLILFATALALGANAETFTVDTSHAEIGFTARHLMISNVKGSFNRFEGNIEFDIESQTLLAMSGSIETSSIDTNNDKRDAHLKTDEFFNIGEYPQMAFSSTAIKPTGEGMFEVTGNLRVLGVDRTVVLPVTVAGPIDDPWGNKRIGLSCSSVLNRRELGITNSPSTMIGDEVEIEISAEAIYKPGS